MNVFFFFFSPEITSKSKSTVCLNPNSLFKQTQLCRCSRLQCLPSDGLKVTACHGGFLDSFGFSLVEAQGVHGERKTLVASQKGGNGVKQDAQWKSE